MIELKKLLKTLFLLFRDYMEPEESLCEFDAELESDGSITIHIFNENEKRKITGKASAWMLLCSQFWAACQSRQKYGLFQNGVLSSLNFENEHKIYKDLKVSGCLIQIGYYFLDHKQEEEAENCFWSAISRIYFADFDQLLEKIPSQFQSLFKQYRNSFLHDEMWEGKKSMGKLGGVKAAEKILKKYSTPHHQYCALESIRICLEISGDFPSYITGKGIDDIMREQVIPLMESPIGFVQQEATEELELWTRNVFEVYTRSPKTKDNLYFFERILEYVPILEKKGVCMSSLFLLKWEALLALGQYDKADQLWKQYEFLLTQNDYSVGSDMFNRGDRIDYRAIGLARVAIILTHQKKLSVEQKNYALRLAEEAYDLAHDRIDAAVPGPSEEKVAHIKGKYEAIYEALAHTNELIGNTEKALHYFQEADALGRKYGLSWRRNATEVYAADLERLQKKL